MGGDDYWLYYKSLERGTFEGLQRVSATPSQVECTAHELLLRLRGVATGDGFGHFKPAATISSFESAQRAPPDCAAQIDLEALLRQEKLATHSWSVIVLPANHVTRTRPMKENLTLAIRTAVSALAIQVYKIFVSMPLGEALSLVLSVVICAFCSRILEQALLSWPLRFYIIRRHLMPEARFEGVWINVLDNIPRRPISIACIEYNCSSGKYRYHGFGFEESGELRASWASTDVKFNLGQDSLWYIAQGQIRDAKAETIDSFGRLHFSRDNSNSPAQGTGFFVDFGTRLIKTTFVMRRLTSAAGSSGKSRPVTTMPDIAEMTRLAREHYGSQAAPSRAIQ